MISNQMKNYAIIENIFRELPIKTERVVRDKKVVRRTVIELPKQCRAGTIDSRIIGKIVDKCKKYEKIRHSNVEQIQEIRFQESAGQKWIQVYGQNCQEDLYDFISGPDFQDKQMVKQVLIDVVQGLLFLHHQGISYQNIDLSLVQRDRQTGRHKLAFGCFREIMNFNCWKNRSRYSAPEVLQDQGYDLSADIWSLGVLFIEIITGESLENGQKSKEEESGVIDFSSFIDRLPNGQIRGLIRQMLKKQPEQRLTIEQVQKRINFLDLSLEDQEDEEEIEEKQELVFMSLPLIIYNTYEKTIEKKNQPERDPITFHNKEYVIVVKYDQLNVLLEISVKKHESKMNLISSRLRYSDFPKLFRLNFKDAKELYEQMGSISSRNCRLSNAGELILGFSSDLQLITQIAPEQSAPIPASSTKQKASKVEGSPNTSKPEQFRLDFPQQTNSFPKDTKLSSFDSSNSYPKSEDLYYGGQSSSTFGKKTTFTSSIAHQMKNKYYEQKIKQCRQAIQQKKLFYPGGSELLVWTEMASISICLQKLHKYEESQEQAQKLFQIVERNKKQELFVFAFDSGHEKSQIFQNFYGNALGVSMILGPQHQQKWQERILKQFGQENKNIKIYALMIVVQSPKMDYQKQKKTAILLELVDLLDCSESEVKEEFIIFYYDVAAGLSYLGPWHLQNIFKMYHLVMIVAKNNPKYSSYQTHIFKDLMAMNDMMKFTGYVEYISVAKALTKAYMPEQYGLFYED